MNILHSETYVDKSKWTRGEWDNEPDKIEWRHEETNLPCLIVRGPHGALCGYVGVSEKHPHFEKKYEYFYPCGDYESEAPTLDTHGGLTFFDKCQEGGKICHIPLDGESDNVWWLGFDCAHSGDFSPAYQKIRFGEYESYKDLRYVTEKVNSLAEQLSRIK